MTAILLQKVYPNDSLRRSRDIGRVVAQLEDLPLDKAWRVEIEQAKRTRTDAQNNYYHGVVLERITQAWGVDMNDAHEWLCGTRWGWKDKKVPKTPRNPDGIESKPRRTTTRNEDDIRDVLGTMQMEEFIEFAKRFAAVKLGINVPDPDPDYREHREQERTAA